MSISYKGIVGHYAKTTLPSVEMWGSNMNILRDPPKSITTRKIDKVGDTSEIPQMIQDSGNRVAEVIMVYGRGKNPMVEVSYDNYGNNGGQKKGYVNVPGSNKQAFLPYRVARDGAFRPPARDQRDLLPLSRLPRVWTSSFTQPGFADFSKRAMFDPNCQTRATKDDEKMLKACVRPTATYSIEMPVQENYKAKEYIQTPVRVEGYSRKETGTRLNGEMGEYNLPDTLKVEYNVNKSGLDKKVDVVKNTGKNIRENFTVDYTCARSGLEKNNFNYDDRDLQRNLPAYEATTNKGASLEVNQFEDHVAEREYIPNRPVAQGRTNVHIAMGTFEQENREVYLRPTVNPGGFQGTPNMPGVERDNDQYGFVDARKSHMRQSVYDMQTERNTTVNQIQYAY